MFKALVVLGTLTLVSGYDSKYAVRFLGEDHTTESNDDDKNTIDHDDSHDPKEAAEDHAADADSSAGHGVPVLEMIPSNTASQQNNAPAVSGRPVPASEISNAMNLLNPMPLSTSILGTNTLSPSLAEQIAERQQYLATLQKQIEQQQAQLAASLSNVLNTGTTNSHIPGLSQTSATDALQALLAGSSATNNNSNVTNQPSTPNAQTQLQELLASLQPGATQHGQQSLTAATHDASKELQSTNSTIAPLEDIQQNLAQSLYSAGNLSSSALNTSELNQMLAGLSTGQNTQMSSNSLVNTAVNPLSTLTTPSLGNTSDPNSLLSSLTNPNLAAVSSLPGASSTSDSATDSLNSLLASLSNPTATTQNTSQILQSLTGNTSNAVNSIGFLGSTGAQGATNAASNAATTTTNGLLSGLSGLTGAGSTATNDLNGLLAGLTNPQGSAAAAAATPATNSLDNLTGQIQNSLGNLGGNLSSNTAGVTASPTNDIMSYYQNLVNQLNQSLNLSGVRRLGEMQQASNSLTQLLKQLSSLQENHVNVQNQPANAASLQNLLQNSNHQLTSLTGSPVSQGTTSNLQGISSSPWLINNPYANLFGQQNKPSSSSVPAQTYTVADVVATLSAGQADLTGLVKNLADSNLDVNKIVKASLSSRPSIDEFLRVVADSDLDVKEILTSIAAKDIDINLLIKQLAHSNVSLDTIFRNLANGGVDFNKVIKSLADANIDIDGGLNKLASTGIDASLVLNSPALPGMVNAGVLTNPQLGELLGSLPSAK